MNTQPAQVHPASSPDRPSPAVRPKKNRARPKKPRTGATRYDPEFAVLICERIATTPRSLIKICEAPDMPGIATVFRWLRDRPKFRELYALAKQAQADLLIEEALDIADDDSDDLIETADGKILFNRAAIQRSKMRIEHRKWIAAKLLPRRYGAQPEQDSASPPKPEPSSEVVFTVEQMKQIQERRRAAIEAWPHEISAPADPPPEADEAHEAPEPPTGFPSTNPDDSPPSAADFPSTDSDSPSPPVCHLPSAISHSYPPIPDFPPPNSDAWLPRPKPSSDHRPKRWYDIPVSDPPRPKSTMNKACS